MSYPPDPNNPYGQQPQPDPNNPYGQQQPGYGYPQGQQPAGYEAYPQQGFPPQGVYPNAQPVLAHWGLRVASYIIDSLIILIPYYVLVFLGRASGAGALLTLLGFVLLIGGALYICYLEGTTGQSPGKKVVGTRVLREQDGQVIGFGAAFGRRLLHIVDGLPCYIGYLWPIWDDKKQTFADKIMKTVVIKSQ
ncbi:RDD family protein [Peterkaempfera bronchialis]|uniref:RDD family protein n=1 Tax=Peterkaempfera bronchialis TaxID=2126346 RepID=A0A345SW46_9ACTN|nr:RDD family protein [Peterkaempfera bronchialis]AXI77951.1 RDD family protein [Peterkaempfera bronchialis]